ncbi:MAG TPA: hypothetical protein VK589_02765, partial [Chryseolinea sp.]|nr:hypothetical protein [Chryseolinea sp.]
MQLESASSAFTIVQSHSRHLKQITLGPTNNSSAPAPPDASGSVGKKHTRLTHKLSTKLQMQVKPPMLGAGAENAKESPQKAQK